MTGTERGQGVAPWRASLNRRRSSVSDGISACGSWVVIATRSVTAFWNSSKSSTCLSTTMHGRQMPAIHCAEKESMPSIIMVGYTSTVHPLSQAYAVTISIISVEDALELKRSDSRRCMCACAIDRSSEQAYVRAGRACARACACLCVRASVVGEQASG